MKKEPPAQGFLPLHFGIFWRDFLIVRALPAPLSPFDKGFGVSIFPKISATFLIPKN
jgi:hypothetical protein